MFAYLKGTVVSCQDSSVIIDVAGVGYSLSVARSECFEQNALAKIYTYMHWVQEQGPVLYGFLSEIERDIFLLVISCSGMGPKIALAVLAQLSPVQFLQIIQEGNQPGLSAVNGIGAKKAEQIIVQLRHKVGKLIAKGLDISHENKSFEVWKNLSDVLHSLHYSRQEIETALTHTRTQVSGKEYIFDELLRHSLSFLAKRL